MAIGPHGALGVLAASPAAMERFPGQGPVATQHHQTEA